MLYESRMNLYFIQLGRAPTERFTPQLVQFVTHRAAEYQRIPKKVAQTLCGGKILLQLAGEGERKF